MNIDKSRGIKKLKKTYKSKSVINTKRKYNDMSAGFIKGSYETNEISNIDFAIYKYLISNKAINYDDNILKNMPKEFIDERAGKIISYMDKLKELKNIPLIQQRSEEWFELRKNRLTASVLDEAIKENNLKLAKKKAGIIKDNTNYSTIPSLKWGVMFEPMACRCYSQSRNNIKINEFGFIIDKTLENFGASPDGITELGIMIEIKCPYSREIIDNNIPEKYYLQIQGQLAVCDLEECDYIECNFITFESVYKYSSYIENEMNNSLINHGVIAEYKNLETNEFEYKYSNEYLSVHDTINNINKQVFITNQDKNLKFIKVTPWVLKKMNVQRVLFNKNEWQNNIVPKINDFWKKVEECKNLPIEEEKVKEKKFSFIDDD